MNITLYTRDNCSFCEASKNILNLRNIPYTELKLEQDITREFLLTLYPTAKMLPVIIVDDEYIGGHEELLQKLFELDMNEETRDANKWR